MFFSVFVSRRGRRRKKGRRKPETTQKILFLLFLSECLEKEEFDFVVVFLFCLLLEKEGVKEEVEEEDDIEKELLDKTY